MTTDDNQREHHELTVSKITGGSYTNDGRFACLTFEDDKGNDFDVNIPTDQAHNAATAILVATGGADAARGMQATRFVQTRQIGIGRNAQSPNDLFVQVLYLANGGQLSFQFDRAAAYTLLAGLQEFLNDPGLPTPKH